MDSVEDIKSRLDIADLIGEYLPMKPAGANTWKALCPFHHEKTPSFYISRARQSWHCFGCDQGGDQFTFVEKMEGMEFREALELLAQKTGVVLPTFDHEKASQKKRLVEVHDLAVKFFRSALQNLPQAEMARQYLAKRGLDDLTIDLFKLGYAPDSWSALTDAMQSKGVTADELLRAGLAIKSDRGGVYDRFRHRVMFPIADVHGNIVGFTARILVDDKKEAKYVNTPETQLYRKSAILYGLDKAKGEIRSQDLAVIVEGNMDVIGSHQFGVANVVASSGTALTVEQLALLKRFTTNLAIAFDQDAAGNAATLRGLDLARAQDFSLKIITLPPEAGKDPDDAVRKNPQLWKDAIKDAVGIMEWIYRNAFKNRHAEQPDDKKAIAKDVLPEIKRIADPIERDHWLKRLAKDLAVGEEALKEAMGIQRDRPSAGPSPKPASPKPQSQERLSHSSQNDLEQRVLANLLVHQEILQSAIDDLLLRPDEFDAPDLSALYARLKALYTADEHPTTATGILSGQAIRPPAGLTPEETKTFDALAFLAEREFQDQPLESLKREVITQIELMRRHRKVRERKQLEEQMREAERVGDQARIAELMQIFKSFQT